MKVMIMVIMTMGKGGGAGRETFNIVCDHIRQHVKIDKGGRKLRPFWP